MHPQLMLLLEIQDLHLQRSALLEEPAIEKMESNHFNIDPQVAAQALDEKIEELKEELDLRVTDVGDCIATFQDPSSPFIIAFTETRVVGQPRAIEHQAIAWFTLDQLQTLDLAPSDRRFVRLLEEREAEPGPATGRWRLSSSR